MGDEHKQPLTLISIFRNAKLYRLKVNLSNLKILVIEAGLTWVLLIAFNWGKIEQVKDTGIYLRRCIIGCTPDEGIYDTNNDCSEAYFKIETCNTCPYRD